MEKFINKVGKLFLILIFSAGFLFNSCQEIIDLEPFDQISETAAFSTPELIALSVNGMYNAAQLGEFGGGRGYPFGAAFVQQGDNRGEDVVNWYTFYGITYQGTYSPSTANNVFYWSETYRLINRCNIIIEGVQDAAANGVISESLANEYEGEARLLRAAGYHELLKMFARPYRHTADASHWGVPYNKVPFTTQDAIDIGFETGRHSVAECYQWILEDLDFAEQHLPLKADRTGNQKMSKGTKEAAAAYKVRVNQHMWNMPQVITEALKFVTGPYSSSYSLHANPWAAFVGGAYGSNEHIFGMESSETNYPSVNGALASQYNRRNLVSMSPIIWRNEFWLPDDKRRVGTSAPDQDDRMVRWISGRILTDKYKRGTEMDDLSPMMRYPEVLLNLAEAYARGGDGANAVTYLNMVRDRSLADPEAQSYDLAADFGGNAVNVLEAILAERRIELVMEGSRWPDIHRLQQCPHFPIAGVPAKVANAVTPPEAFYVANSPYDPWTPYWEALQEAESTYAPNEVYLNEGAYEGPRGVTAIPYDDHRFVWPIPQNEIDSNPTLQAQQNPGY
ncbi:MAG: RagB/SusD family nutrient uptake outer membrane protein [Bacteroidales bacterium]